MTDLRARAEALWAILGNEDIPWNEPVDRLEAFAREVAADAWDEGAAAAFDANDLEPTAYQLNAFYKGNPHRKAKP